MGENSHLSTHTKPVGQFLFLAFTHTHKHSRTHRFRMKAAHECTQTCIESRIHQQEAVIEYTHLSTHPDGRQNRQLKGWEGSKGKSLAQSHSLTSAYLPRLARVRLAPFMLELTCAPLPFLSGNEFINSCFHLLTVTFGAYLGNARRCWRNANSLKTFTENTLSFLLGGVVNLFFCFVRDKCQLIRLLLTRTDTREWVRERQMFLTPWC